MLTGAYSVIDCRPCVCLALLILVSWVMDVLCLLNFISDIYIIHEHFSHGPLGLWLPRLPSILVVIVVGQTYPFGSLLFFSSREGQTCS